MELDSWRVRHLGQETKNYDPATNFVAEDSPIPCPALVQGSVPHHRLRSNNHMSPSAAATHMSRTCGRHCARSKADKLARGALRAMVSKEHDVSKDKLRAKEAKAI